MAGRKVSIKVTNPDGTVAEQIDAYEVVAPDPVILGITPNSGPVGGGTQVTINGLNFQPGCSVEFGGRPASIIGASATQLVVVVPDLQ